MPKNATKLTKKLKKPVKKKKHSHVDEELAVKTLTPAQKEAQKIEAEKIIDSINSVTVKNDKYDYTSYVSNCCDWYVMGLLWVVKKNTPPVAGWCAKCGEAALFERKEHEVGK